MTRVLQMSTWTACENLFYIVRPLPLFVIIIFNSYFGDCIFFQKYIVEICVEDWLLFHFFFLNKIMFQKLYLR